MCSASSNSCTKTVQKAICCCVKLHRAPHAEVKDVLEVQEVLKIMMLQQNTSEPSIFNLRPTPPHLPTTNRINAQEDDKAAVNLQLWNVYSTTITQIKCHILMSQIYVCPFILIIVLDHPTHTYTAGTQIDST